MAAHGPDRDLYHNDLDRLRPISIFPEADALPYRPKDSKSDEDWAVPFVGIVLNAGDVLVYIDIPAISSARGATNCEGVVPHNLQFRVHSHNLLSLGDTKFKRLLLNKRKQKKWREVRKPTDKEMEGVDFILDLTPDMEGDDRVFELAELSLTKGIADWWAADKMHKIPESMVRGHDDICSCQQTDRSVDTSKSMTERLVVIRTGESEGGTNENSPPELVALPPLPEDLLRLRAQGVEELFETPPCYQIPDYCPFRHCNSIARLLLMIEGRNVRLNSAARMWTMVGISKIYECPSVVRDVVVQWIMSNPRFVEVLPEETLRIGFNLKLPQITQSAFRILVNEMALEEAADPVNRSEYEKVANTRTVFGRWKEDPGDDKSNAIQHAARALVERVRAQRDMLLSPDLLNFWFPDGKTLGVTSAKDVSNGTEWQKLRSIEHLLASQDDGICSRALATLRALMEALVHRINQKVKMLCEDSYYCRSAYGEMDKDRATYVKPMHFEQIQYIVPCLTADQRLLLPFFYNELGRQCDGDLYWGQKSTHPDSLWKYFSHILRDLEYGLQKVVDADPTRGYDDSWAVLFDEERPRVTIRPAGRLIRSPLIDLDTLGDQVCAALKPITRAWERIDKSFVPQLNITRHMLLTLTNNEMKFLPLWAGGNDDGTGGVFEDPLPPAELGPNGPGPAYHTGITVPSDAESLGSFVDDVRAFNIMGSTTAGSVAVHDSISTVYNPNHVIAADSSIAPSSYGGDEGEFARARYEVPAEHQGVGQAVAMMVDDDPNGTYEDYEIDDDSGSDDTLTELGMISDDDEDQEMVNEPQGAGEAKGTEPTVTDNVDDGQSVISVSESDKSTTTDSDNDSMVLV